MTFFVNRTPEASSPSVEKCSSLGAGSAKRITRTGGMAVLMRQGNIAGNAYSVRGHVCCGSALVSSLHVQGLLVVEEGPCVLYEFEGWDAMLLRDASGDLAVRSWMEMLAEGGTACSGCCSRELIGSYGVWVAVHILVGLAPGKWPDLSLSSLCELWYDWYMVVMFHGRVYDLWQGL
ncbi:hypothetical protein L7F22_030220 [Adiantum nelumboides]|nr:hypothetical protein [Adiantum nelumboides]